MATSTSGTGAPPSTTTAGPHEVVDLVASHLVKASDMTSAACACRAWRGPFQRRVFQKVYFDSSRAAYAFLRCEAAQRHHVEEMHLYTQDMEGGTVASSHREILGRVQGIGALYMSGLNVVPDDQMPDTFKALTKLNLLCEMELRFRDGHAPFIFHRLERLSFMELGSFTFVPFRYGDRSDLARYIQTPVLRHLIFGGDSEIDDAGQAFLQHLFADNGPRLVSVTYKNEYMDERMLDDIVSGLRSCPSLSKLGISLGFYENYQGTLKMTAFRYVAESLAPLPELQELDLSITDVACFRAPKGPAGDVEHLLTQKLFPKLSTLKLTIHLDYPRFVLGAHGEPVYFNKKEHSPVQFFLGPEGGQPRQSVQEKEHRFGPCRHLICHLGRRMGIAYSAFWDPVYLYKESIVSARSR